MTWVNVAIAAGNLIGGKMQSDAAKEAAKTAALPANRAIDLQRRVYEEGIQRQEPFYKAGVNALGQYLEGVKPGGELVRSFNMQDFQADPGYAFRLTEGLKALDRSAAARGGLLSGNQLRGAVQFGQNLGSQEYGTAYDRFINQQNVRRNVLAGLAGQGQTTANTLGTSGQNMASNVGNISMQQGVNAANAGLVGAQARASSYGEAINQLGKVDFGGLYDRMFGSKSMEDFSNQQYPGQG